jgi:hypothetical protein
MDKKSDILKEYKLQEGEGKCLLAASLATQEAYGLKEKGHSIFTYHLLQGLRGANGDSIDNEGRVTPESLGAYVYRKVTESSPKQRPLIKTESSGKITLAEYPRYATRPSPSTPYKRVVDTSSLIDEGQLSVET